MAIKTIEIMDSTGETRELKLVFRPPSRSEIEAFQREIMAMRTLQSGEDDAKIAGSQAFQQKLFEAGHSMMLSVIGEAPDWLEEGTTPGKYVSEYHSAALTRFALEILQVAIGGVIPVRAVEAVQTKN